MANERAPRPYSTLVDGRIIWITPEEHASTKRVRSRSENDDEVRARFRARGLYTYPNLKGKALDAQLDYWNMPPRGFVDEYVT